MTQRSHSRSRRGLAAIPSTGAILLSLGSCPALADSYSVGSGQTTVIAGQIADGAGANAVAVSGGGMLVLGNNANSYSGGTTVTGGSAVAVDADGALGAASGSLTLGDASSSGTLVLSNSQPFASARSVILSGNGLFSANGSGNATFSGVISGSGALTIGGGGLVALTGTNTFTGGLSVVGGTTLEASADANLGGSTGAVTLGNATSSGILSFTNTEAISSARTITLGTGGGTILVNNETGTTLSGVIGGTGALTVGGGGNLVLSGTNTYTGGTLLTDGTTLSVSADGALGTAPTSTTATAGALSIDGGALQFNSAFSSARYITLTANNGFFDTDSYNDTLSGNISGPGGLYKLGSGTLTLTGTESYLGLTEVEAGTLQLGTSSTAFAGLAGDVRVDAGATFEGQGTIAGSLLNNGGEVISGVGASRGLSVASYSQTATSTLGVAMTSNGAATLKVGGEADLAGSLKVLYGSGYLHAGTYQLLTATSLSGSFSSIAAQVPSVGLSSEVLQNGNEVDLILTQLASLPDRPTIYTALSSAAIDEAQDSVGALLAHMVAVRAAADMDELTVAWSPNHRMTSSSPYGLWFQPKGNFGSASAKGDLPGYSQDGYGFLAGWDAALAPGSSFGFSLGYSRTNVSESDGASGSIDTPRAMVYGGWWSGPLAIDGVAGYGRASLDGTRPVSGTNETATASHDGNEVSLALQASLGYDLDGWSISPAAGAKYLNLSEGRYTEKGTDIYNFMVKAADYNSLKPYLNTTVSHRFTVTDHTALVPSVTVGYETELMSTHRTIDALTEGDDAVWRIDGLKSPKSAATMGAGLTMETSKTQGFYVDYDRTQSAQTANQTISAGLRYRL